jgi:DNA-binding winged helix-turn-helix (wHTH) protein/tetratricopeptide (TPR) repeat protein
MDRQAKHFLEFGPFRMDLEERLLKRDQETITLSPKAFETLLVLVQHSERVVLKDDLMKTLWPDTFVEESNLSQHIFQLRKALGDKAHDPHYIVTVSGRGYRFAKKVAEREEPDGDLIVHSRSVQRVTVEEGESQAAVASLARPRQKTWSRILGGAGVVALLGLGSVFVVRLRRPPPLNEADVVLVSDFVNTTGEPVFDGTLKHALTVKLAESPYFNIASDSTNRKTLALMGRSAEDRILPPVAREVCQREGAKVVVGGSILSIGNRYVLDLNATNCLTGASLTHQQIEASDSEHVLSKLGQLIPPLRRNLGESVGSIQKFDTPIEQATTRSLAALKAYTTGEQKRAQGLETESVPFYKMAIDLDADFAMAYARLGTVYGNVNEPDRGDEYLRKAFERREHVSEREKFYIQARYYYNTVQDYEKANETYKLWSEIYTNDGIPFIGLANTYNVTGQLQEAIAASQRALRLSPNLSLSYANLCVAYERATHFAEAKAIGEKSMAEKLDSFAIHQVLYRIAFAESDEPAMQREIAWFKGRPQENLNTYYRAKGALSLGEVRRSRELFERARSSTDQKGREEELAAMFSDEAQFEADMGNAQEARRLAELSIRLTPDSVRQKIWAMIPLARGGEVQRSEALLNELNHEPIPGTTFGEILLPSIRAAVDLNLRKPAAAVEDLRRSLPYDLGADADGFTLYYRGLAYLDLKSWKEAAAEFQKILTNRGIATTSVYWPLSRLGIARAYAQTGDTEKSLEQYRELLTYWKNADPDLRPLKEAKAEYKKLSEPSPSSL